MEALKPCPFCGGDNVKHRADEYLYMNYVYCDDCGAIGPDACATGDEAYQWNQRAERTCKVTPNGYGNGVCSSCKEELEIYDGWNPHDNEFSNVYCPSCGAKVVE